jgi:hypothetical protein
MVKYNILIGLKKTLKNVGIVLAPPVLLQVLISLEFIVPPKYFPLWQALSSLLIYFIKNASENGAWKKKTQ